MEALFEVPNLDCLEREDLTRLNAVFQTLVHYSRNRLRAVEQRAEGNISMALRIEEVCGKYYANLPKEYRW